MVRLALFVLVLFAAAIAFSWLADNPGTVAIAWPWLDENLEYRVTLLQAVIVLAIVIVTIMMVWWVISAVLHSPQAFGRWRSGRRRDKGYRALSRGLIAAGAGDAPTARKLSKESGKLLEDEPLVSLLDAQTAILEGRRQDARLKFEAMTHHDETKLLGLRGLYVEAERENEPEAAAHFALEANEHAPSTPWAAQAVLKGQALAGNWEEALHQLESNRAATLVEKDDYKAKRTVILTALAEQEEGASPDAAKAHALAAHKLDPAFVPAAVLVGRLGTRTGDLRKAAKVLETTWKKSPHPEIAETYVQLRSGDSTLDRLKRAEKLATLRGHSPEGQMAVARAALDAGEWKQARDAMQSVLRNGATERACLLMADIEEAEHGDRGRVREWLSRAVSAPRDPAWTADGVVSDHWAPVSPVTGHIGAFEWRVPVEGIDGPQRSIDYSDLAHEEPKPMVAVLETETVGEAQSPTSTPKDPETLPKADDPTQAADMQTADTQADDPKRPVEDVAAAEAQDAEPSDPSSDKEQAADEETRDEVPSATKLPKNDNDIQPTPKPASDPSPRSETEPKAARATSHTPYKNANFDEDADGVIDKRPDDPGITDTPPKKKAVFF
ncbi:MAG: heme biosynthesis protein HemY [Ahrensia sp.]|nr:heme biosynthesis protein HemY [Ahrensia sp.]